MQNTYVYVLLEEDEVVYIGITSDQERRMEEHQRDGKQFDALRPFAGPMTQAEAEQKEYEYLSAFRLIFGKYPKYNLQNS